MNKNPVTLATLLSEPDQPTAWLIEGLLPKDANVLLTGDGKLGKTYLEVEMAVSLASGTPVLGEFEVPALLNVLLLVSEDSKMSMKKRCLQVINGKRLNSRMDEIAGRIHILCRSGFCLNNCDDIAWLRDYCESNGIEVVFLDPLAEMMLGKENSNDDLKVALQPLKRLRDETGVTYSVAHHQKKPQEFQSARYAHQSRGGGYLTGWYDVGIHFGHAKPGDPVDVQVEMRDEEPPDAFVLARIHDSPDRVVLTYTPGREADVRRRREQTQRIVDFLSEHPRATAGDIDDSKKVKGGKSLKKECLDALVAQGAVTPAREGRAVLYSLTETAFASNFPLANCRNGTLGADGPSKEARNFPRITAPALKVESLAS